MEKPNLERIAEVWDLTWGLWDLEESTSNILNETWENIVYHQNDKIEVQIEHELYNINGKIYERDRVVKPHFAYPEYELLIDLLKDNNLEHLAPDFRFMAYHFTHSQSLKEDKQDIRSNYVTKYRESTLELLVSLKLLREHRNGISINFIRKQRVCGSIVNSDSIHIIEDALFEHLKNIDRQANPNYIDRPLPNNAKNWINYLDIRIEQEKALIDENKLRITIDANWHLRDSVFHLWEYLQRFTELKAIEGHEFSREQGRFIFRFFEIIGLINKKINRKEDVIRYYLNSYREELSSLSQNKTSKSININE